MLLLIEAIYKNGKFIPDQRLSLEKEGKKFKLYIVEEEKAHVKKKRFFEFAEKQRFALPSNYKFNREEVK